MSSRWSSYFWVKNACFVNLFLMISNSWENPRWTPGWRPLLVTSWASSSPSTPHCTMVGVWICVYVRGLIRYNTWNTYTHWDWTVLWYFCDNDVTMSLSAFSLEMLYARKVWVLAFCCAKFHKNFELLWIFHMKATIYASTEYWTVCKQICYFLDFFGRIFKPLEAGRLVRFQKTGKDMHQGKTQCWTLFAICKATLFYFH